MAAHVVPFVVFMVFLPITQSLGVFGVGEGLFREPKYWLYPLQTVCCAVALALYWRHYDFQPRGWFTAIAAGVAALLVWMSPQWVFAQPPRLDGFNPDLFEADPSLYWFTVLMRFVRLVVIVPLIEEIFWRGFLMRTLVNDNFTAVRFGTYTPLSFFGVAIAFTLVHSPEDWPAAFLTGLLFGWVAIRTRSLAACVAAHAVTNLLLGLIIMDTKQWGFW
jgi:hypothetical protein